jgi:hypothetical protein
MPEVEFNGFDELDRAIDQLPEMALDAAVPAMGDATLYIHENLPEYPPSSMESLAPDGWSFVSEKQRRAFFAMVKAGKIKGWKWQIDQVMGLRGKMIQDAHPQKTGSARTGTLGRKFTEDTQRGENAVIGLVGTNTPYAPWVVGPDYPGESINGQTMYQAKVHQNRWWQFYDEFDSSADGAWDAFDERFYAELQKRWAEGQNGL